MKKILTFLFVVLAFQLNAQNTIKTIHVPNNRTPIHQALSIYNKILDDSAHVEYQTLGYIPSSGTIQGYQNLLVETPSLVSLKGISAVTVNDSLSELRGLITINHDSIISYDDRLLTDKNLFLDSLTIHRELIQVNSDSIDTLRKKLSETSFKGFPNAVMFGDGLGKIKQDTAHFSYDTTNYVLRASGGVNIDSGAVYYYAGIPAFKLTKYGSQTDYNGVVIGRLAGGKDPDAYEEVSIGYKASQNAQAHNLISIGPYAGWYTNGSNTISIGNSAGNNAQNTSGNNIFIGNSSGSWSTGHNSYFFGPYSGAHFSGSYILGVGRYSAQYASGSNGAFFGSNSGNHFTGSNVVGIGYNSASTSSSIYSSYFGYNSGTSSNNYYSLGFGNNALAYSRADNLIGIGQYALAHDTISFEFAIRNSNFLDDLPLLAGNFRDGNIDVPKSLNLVCLQVNNLYAVLGNSGSIPAGHYWINVVPISDGQFGEPVYSVGGVSGSGGGYTLDGTNTNSIKAYWNPVPGADSYRIYIGVSDNLVYTRYYSTTDTTFTITQYGSTDGSVITPSNLQYNYVTVHAPSTHISNSEDSYFMSNYNYGFGTKHPKHKIDVVNGAVAADTLFVHTKGMVSNLNSNYLQGIDTTWIKNLINGSGGVSLSNVSDTYIPYDSAGYLRNSPIKVTAGNGVTMGSSSLASGLIMYGQINVNNVGGVTAATQIYSWGLNFINSPDLVPNTTNSTDINIGNATNNWNNVNLHGTNVNIQGTLHITFGTAPADSTAAGSAGTVIFATNGNIYVCLSTNSWKVYKGSGF